jgi:hypothetical protein
MLTATAMTAIALGLLTQHADAQTATVTKPPSVGEFVCVTGTPISPGSTPMPFAGVPYLQKGTAITTGPGSPFTEFILQDGIYEIILTYTAPQWGGYLTPLVNGQQTSPIWPGVQQNMDANLPPPIGFPAIALIPIIQPNSVLTFENFGNAVYTQGGNCQPPWTTSLVIGKPGTCAKCDRCREFGTANIDIE